MTRRVITAAHIRAVADEHRDRLLEIDCVVEGELHIKTDGETVVALPGEIVFIPKGTSIKFATPSWAKFLYVTFPAEWSGA